MSRDLKRAARWDTNSGERVAYFSKEQILKTQYSFLLIVLLLSARAQAVLPSLYFPVLMWEMSNGGGSAQNIVLLSSGDVHFTVIGANGMQNTKIIAHFDRAIVDGLSKAIAQVPADLQPKDPNPNSASCANPTRASYSVFKKSSTIAIRFYAEAGCHVYEPAGETAGTLDDMKQVLDGLQRSTKFLKP
jgi:hypothetical protein